MMSNVLDAIKEGQKASQEVAKQVEELAQLRSSDIMFQSQTQKNGTCCTLAELTEWHTSGDVNVLLFKDGTILIDRRVADLQTLIEEVKMSSTTTYIVWKQL